MKSLIVLITKKRNVDFAEVPGAKIYLKNLEYRAFVSRLYEHFIKILQCQFFYRARCKQV
jgi:hypothetical protein